MEDFSTMTNGSGLAAVAALAILLTGAFLTTATAARAADLGLTEHHLDSPGYRAHCVDADLPNMEAQLVCENAELDRQNALLNQSYQALRSTLSPVQQLALRDAERAWIKHRDALAEKAAEADAFPSGLATEAASTRYLIALTETRTLYLQRLLPHGH
jgi:uncharacterized protein YecT (DUF1311 family)